MAFSDKHISGLVEDQLPEFIANDFSTFTLFLKSYYEYMEQTGGASDAARPIVTGKQREC